MILQLRMRFCDKQERFFNNEQVKFIVKRCPCCYIQKSLNVRHLQDEVFLFDFAKLRKQNQTIIDQNEKVISLLEEIKNK